MNRQVVKSDFASVKIPEVDLEIPAKSQNGGKDTAAFAKCKLLYMLFFAEITTVEGIIDRAITGLELDQETRRKEDSENASKIDDFIERLKDLKNIKHPFKMVS